MLRRVLAEAKAQGLEPVANRLPRRLLRGVLAQATRGLSVGVCLHRVLPAPRPFMLSPGLAHTEQELDAFLDLFRDIPERLCMTFDDGYDDARRYIAARAPRHPAVRFFFMVCPDKTERRFGFAWDSWVTDGQDRDEGAFQQQWRASLDLTAEHSGTREGVGDLDHYRLATVDDVRALGALPNVALGNHTDHHIPTAWLTDDELAHELRASQARFTRLFGPPRHFAFPFGTETYVRARDIDLAVTLCAGTVWTVDTAPIDGGRVWARFAWASDEYSPAAMALYIAMKCVQHKAGARPDTAYPA